MIQEFINKDTGEVIYQTDDQNLHRTLEMAQSHEAKLLLIDTYYNCSIYGRIEDSNHLIEFLIDNSETIQKFLQVY